MYSYPIFYYFCEGWVHIIVADNIIPTITPNNEHINIVCTLIASTISCVFLSMLVYKLSLRASVRHWVAHTLRMLNVNVPDFTMEHTWLRQVVQDAFAGTFRPVLLIRGFVAPNVICKWWDLSTDAVAGLLFLVPGEVSSHHTNGSERH